MSTTVTSYLELERALERWETIHIVGLDLGYKELEAPMFRLENCYGKGPATLKAGIVELVDCTLSEIRTDANILRVYDSRIQTITATNAERVIVSGAYIGSLEVGNAEIVLLNSYVGWVSGKPTIKGANRSYLEVELNEEIELDLI